MREDARVRLKLPFHRRNRQARRALCLGAIVIRGEYERVVQDLTEPAVMETHQSLTADLDSWLRATELQREQSPEERRMFSQRLGSWPAQDIINASWRTEALGMFVWALGHMTKLPPWDTQIDQASVIRPLGLMSDPEPFEQSRVRPDDDISRARDLAELWHWRARTAQLQRRGGVQLPAGLTFEEIIASTAKGAHEAGDITVPIDADFPALGKAYRDLDDGEYATATSIAEERHFALNWLCGYAHEWDETPTDT